MAAITAAELLLGVELADARRRSGRKGYVEAVISTIPIEDYKGFGDLPGVVVRSLPPAPER